MKTEPNEGWAYMPWKDIYTMWEIRLYHDAIVRQMAIYPDYFTMTCISKRFFNHIQKRVSHDYFTYKGGKYHG